MREYKGVEKRNFADELKYVEEMFPNAVKRGDVDTLLTDCDKRSCKGCPNEEFCDNIIKQIAKPVDRRKIKSKPKPKRCVCNKKRK
jgi:hypothetical protein